jgi:hypothetical protein
MPSVSKKQHNLMAAVAHNPKFAKKVGIPQSVGDDFMKADKGKQFKRGGEMATKMKMFEKSGKDVEKKGMKEGSKADMALDKKQMMGMKKGGKAKCMAKGGSVKASAMGKVTAGGIKKFGEHNVQTKGHTKGRNLGDSGKTVGIQSGARGMKRGGKC